MNSQEMINLLSEHGITATKQEVTRVYSGSLSSLSAIDAPEILELWSQKSGKAKPATAQAITVQSSEVSSLAAEIESTKPVANIPAVHASVDPTELLAASQKRALDASVRAAATMGDSTSGLYAKVEQKLENLRAERDEPLAEQIAQRVFDAENHNLGKSFTGLLTYMQQFDTWKGSPIEGLTGASTINVNDLLKTSAQ